MARELANRPFVHDLYAPIAHLIGDGTVAPPPGLNPAWADDSDTRRLLAYRALAALLDNVRRYWLPKSLWERELRIDGRGTLTSVGDSPADQFREYGHAMTLVETARALVLGDTQALTVPAAAPPAPADENANGDPADNPPAPDPAQAFAATVQDWLDEWADDVHLDEKLLEGEEDSIGKGDAVYVLRWAADRQRPRVRVYDPGFYFPDWEAVDSRTYAGWGWDDDDYPPIVHLAWEIEHEGAGFLQRATWRLVPVDGEITVDDNGRTILPTKRYPWGLSSWRCLYSRIEVPIDRIDRQDTVYTLGTHSAATVLEAEIDLGLDFVPVVHVPNDSPGGRRFGRSLLLKVAQLLDDLSGGDTDLAVNAELVASSPTVTTGISDVDLDGGPGARWELPTGATAGLVDTSKSLDALLKYADRLLDVLATNSRVSAALQGRVKPNEVPSGYALRLGFAPALALLRELRRVRLSKYPLLGKFAVRMAQAAGALDAGDTPKIVAELGSSLPADRAATIEEVRVLLSTVPPAISTRTALAMLTAVGVPIDDVDAELERIRAEDLTGANTLVDATGNVDDAYAYLGREPAARRPGETQPAPVAPTPTLP